MSEDLQVKLLVELWQVPLGRGGEEFGGQRRQDAVIAGGMVTQDLLHLRGHQAGVASAGQEMAEAGKQFLATGNYP